jgi:antitoxin YefM
VVPLPISAAEEHHFGDHGFRSAQEPFPLIEQVNDDRTPVEITSKRGDAVLMSRADYDALEETAHLLRSPANARRLVESLTQGQRGEREEHAPAR